MCAKEKQGKLESHQLYLLKKERRKLCSQNVREDLTDLLSDITPVRTPLYDLICNKNKQNTLVEWIKDN